MQWELCQIHIYTIEFQVYGILAFWKGNIILLKWEFGDRVILWKTYYYSNIFFWEYNEWLDVNIRSSTPYSGTVNNVWINERMV